MLCDCSDAVNGKRKTKIVGKLCFSARRKGEIKYDGFTLESTPVLVSVITRASLTICFNTCKYDFSEMKPLNYRFAHPVCCSYLSEGHTLPLRHAGSFPELF